MLATSLFAGTQIVSFAQIQNAVGGGANGASVNVSATVLGLPATVQVPAVAPVNLPSQGGSFNNQVASVNVGITPGVLPVLSTGLVVNSTEGSLSQTSAHAESTSTINNLNILNGLVTAATIRSKSTSDGNGAAATSSAAGSFANQLRIGGILHQQSEFAPNTEVSVSASVIAMVGGLPVLVPLSGTVIINEQIAGGNGQTTSSLTVNSLHVNVSGSVAGLITLNANIIVASASSSLSFVAAGNNNPPSLSVPGTQSVQAGSTLTFNVTGSDPDAGDTVTLSVSNVPANAGFNHSAGNPANGQFTFTPAQSQAGQTFTVNFTATDTHGASVSRSVSITVASGPPPPNNPPNISVPGPQTVQVGATLTFGASASDPDNGDTVTLSASNLPAGSSVNPNPATGNPAASQFSFTPTQNHAGQTFTVNFTAMDNHGASVSRSVQITVTAGAPPANNPPIISVPGPQVIGVGDLLTFTVTASDPDDHAVTLSATSVPPNGTFNAPTGNFAFSPASNQAGQVFVVTFTATDSEGASASGTVQITVTTSAGDGNPQPPIISVPPSPIIIPVGQLLTFVVTAGSPRANCNVTLSAGGRPDHSEFDGPTGRFGFTPAIDQQDKSFVVTFTATDCGGLTASATVTIMVVSPAGEVTGPGRVCVPITKITFGPTPTNGSCGFLKISLTNEGKGNLTINSLRLNDGQHFRVEGISNMPLVLKSAAVLELKIMFQPKATGQLVDTITILTSDPSRPSVTIVLKGKGARSL